MVRAVATGAPALLTGKTNLRLMQMLIMAGGPLEVAQPTTTTTITTTITTTTTTTAGVMTLAVQEVEEVKLTTRAVVASSPVTLLENVLNHATTAASTVVNQVICPGTAQSQRNLVVVIAPAGNATRLATLLATAPQVVEVEEIGRVTNAVKSATLLVIALQEVEAEEIERVTDVARLVTFRASVPLLPLALQPVGAVAA